MKAISRWVMAGMIVAGSSTMARAQEDTQPPAGRREVVSKVIEKRKAQKTRKAVLRAQKADQAIREVQEQRDYQARIAPYVAKVQAEQVRQAATYDRNRAEYFKAQAQFQQAQAMQRQARAIEWQAWRNR